MSVTADLGYAHTEPNALQRLTRAWVASPVGAVTVSRFLHVLDRMVFRATRGRATATSILSGLPVITLTTTGARTGLARTVPLVAIPFGDDLAIIGSNFGQSRRPGWVHNLAVNPTAKVRYRNREIAVTARHATTVETENAFAAGVVVYPGYGTYRERATDRVITVFVLQAVR
ncbi:MAG: nitroreductase family deazaflavin-dependent oxidoreductase [Acidimicrobiia bacterium]|nr:nitroreductase family deazaflavin-dependent oxidoreductase [Acidimicrobiia bacterium]